MDRDMLSSDISDRSRGAHTLNEIKRIKASARLLFKSIGSSFIIRDKIQLR